MIIVDNGLYCTRTLYLVVTLTNYSISGTLYVRATQGG